MKKLILVIIVSLFPISAFTQDYIDPDSYLYKVNIPDSIYNKNPGRFVKGWTCSSESRKLDSAMSMNFNLNQHEVSSSNPWGYWFMKGQNWIYYISDIAAGDRYDSFIQAQAMHYEPALEVNRADPFDVSLRFDDTNRPVFGFGYIRVYKETNSNSRFYHYPVIFLTH